MNFDPVKHHRRSLRLRHYDYAEPGAYFVTIVAQDRACLFGDIVDGEMALTDAGRMVETVWDEIPKHYPSVDIDAFVVMPNHVHGIVVLVGAAPRGRPTPVGQPGRMGQPLGRDPTGLHMGQPWRLGRPRGAAPTGTEMGQSPDMEQPRDMGQPRGGAPTGLSLADVVHRFKTMTTKRYADGVKQWGWSAFRGRLWQRNYYEHIIRNEAGLERIREYVLQNPLRWSLDRENPAHTGSDDFDVWLAGRGGSH